MKSIAAFFLLFTLTLSSFAQNSDNIINNRLPLDEVLFTDDNGVSTFDIQKGDTLIFAVNAGGSQYDFVVSVNEYSYDNGIKFNWYMTEPVGLSGNIIVTPDAKNNATRYHNYFSYGEKTLTDASCIWLSGTNFGDMPARTTSIKMDNNAAENYLRPQDDAVKHVINYRGKEVTLDAFKINNGKEAPYTRELHVLNTSANPLIVSMNLGWTISLKEIR